MARRPDDAPSDTTIPPNDTTVVRERERPVARRRYGPYRDRGSGGDLGWLWVLAGLAILVLLAVFLIPLLTPGDSAGREAGTTVSEITDNPSEFIGQTVSVSGEVEDIVAPRAFTMGDEGFLFGEELLVVGAQGPAPTGGPPFSEVFVNDQAVQVNGTVRRFNLAEFEREIGFDLDDNALRPFEGEAAIIARRIVDPTKLARVEMVPGQNVRTTLPNIVDNPSEFYGATVTLSGNVQNVLGPQAFTLGSPPPGGEELLVVGAGRDIPQPLNPGTNVRVTGTVQPFDLSVFERALGVDLADDTFLTWVGRPALLASSVSAAS